VAAFLAHPVYVVSVSQLHNKSRNEVSLARDVGEARIVNNGRRMRHVFINDLLNLLSSSLLCLDNDSMVFSFYVQNKTTPDSIIILAAFGSCFAYYSPFGVIHIH